MKMLIGLTGRTGSGKSSAARIFEKLGGYVSDCDKVAHTVLKDSKIIKVLSDEFGSTILDSIGEIDRKKLGAVVFSDSEKLKFLNKAVHGAVVEKCIDECLHSGKDICFMDGSELESSGADEKCRHIIVITADEKTRLSRIMQRDNIDRETALRRMNSQKEYSKEAIFVDNSGSISELEEKLKVIYNSFSGDLNE